MKIKPFSKKAICVAVVSALPVFAQAAAVFEGEAFLATGLNDTIAAAQDIGTLNLSGFQIFGSRLDVLPGGDSADFFKFAVSAPTQVSLAVTTPTGKILGNDSVLGLYSSTGFQIANDNDSGGGFNSFLSRYLAAGTYYAAVSGYSDFTFAGGGDKNWVYNLAIAPVVPEPESYAMFLAGLGLMGVIVRRRMRSQS